MIIDGNELEIESLKELKAGNVEKSHALEDEFIRQAKEQPRGGCSCYMLNCRWHGKCYECVLLHRGAGDHLPNCFHSLINERLQGVLNLTESKAVKAFGNEK